MKALAQKIITIRNWIGKAFLMLLGMALAVAVFYRDFMEMTYLSDKEAPPWEPKHYGMLAFAVGCVVGGYVLNNILDGLSAGFKNLINKITK